MKTVGKQLLEARTAKGWSPEMAARETKIRLDRLRELEEDDYTNFSSPTYARGFVRTYARALGLDEYRILRQLDNKLPEDDNASFINDSGIPYMPEPSQVAKPFELTRGVYIAGGVGAAVLLFIGFILVEAYRADLFTTATPAPVALPVTSTNALPALPETETARAMPADSNSAPVALPVDQAALAAAQPAPVPASAPASAPLRALPVDLNAADTTTNPPPVAGVTVPAAVVATPLPASSVPQVPANPGTVPTATATPPRALPVDLNALTSADLPTTPVAPTVALSTGADPASVPVPSQMPAPHSASARQSNSGPAAHPAADKATQDLIAATAPASAPVAPLAPATTSTDPAASATTPSQVVQSAPATDRPPTASAAPITGESSTPSSLVPAASPVSTTDPVGTAVSAQATGKGHGKRLVLTASHDSFVRVVSLDGSSSGQVRYSSTLKTGESISFDDHKYSINVGDPSAVDIALDGVNYGPHSENSSPDTFTVESHTP